MKIKYRNFNSFTCSNFLGEQITIEAHSELDIETKDNVDYVMDGCAPLFELNSEIAKEKGEIVKRLW